jgi:hypothetical protein
MGEAGKMTLGRFAAMNVPQVGPPREFIWILLV